MYKMYKEEVQNYLNKKMETFVRDLYYGDLNPLEEDRTNIEEFKKLPFNEGVLFIRMYFGDKGTDAYTLHFYKEFKDKFQSIDN